MSRDLLPALIFPSFDMKISRDDHATKIFDPVRRSYVSLTPEEWVRQHCLHWLLSRGYPMGRCSVERSVERTSAANAQRFDLLWRDAHLNPFLLVECKATTTPINDATLRQTAWYNLSLKAPFILLTNGLTAFCARIADDGMVEPQTDIPDYSLVR